MMALDPQELREIVARSLPLFERLTAHSGCTTQPANDERVETRLQRWCQVVAQGNWERFARRLAWDGLDMAQARSLLRGGPLAAAQPLPAWTDMLQSGLRTVASMSPPPRDTTALPRCCHPAEPLPFEEVLLPFVATAHQHLQTQVGELTHVLSSEAWASLERALLQALVTLCAQPLLLEFSLQRAQGQSLAHRLFGPVASSNAKEQYTKFVGAMLQGGLVSFFREYSVLARLVALTTCFWVEANADFLRHLHSDWTCIQQMFHPAAPLGQVIAIRASLSDAHYSGRSVYGIKFSSGLKLVYKPRNLAMDEAYNQLLAWIQQHAGDASLRYPTVLNRGTRGWVEYIETAPCQDTAAMRRYFRRCGMLLAVLYVLGATDCHTENLLAAGEYPVVIDLETLLCPRLRDSADPETAPPSSANVYQYLQDSVLQTRLLPAWEVLGGEGAIIDLSGWGREMAYARRMPQWLEINTDSMRVHDTTQMVPLAVDTPAPEAMDTTLASNIDEMTTGFQELYAFFRHQRHVLLSPEGPLGALAHQPVRFLFRNSRGYQTVLTRALHPQFLRDGADHSIAIDYLSRAVHTPTYKPHWWPLIQAEHAAMAQMDLPHFLGRTDSTALVLATSTVLPHCFSMPSYQAMVQRLQRLDDADLARQIAFIRGSWFARTTTTLHCHRAPACLATAEAAALTRDDLLQQATSIGQRLQHSAIAGGDGSVAWLGLTYAPNLQRFQPGVLPPGLYDGWGGIGLFLAALGHVTQQAMFRDLALATLQSRQAILREINQQPRTLAGFEAGGLFGLGSLLYTLVRSSQWLGEASLLEDALRLATRLSTAWASQDMTPDVLYGTAGAILCLLPLYEATDESTILTYALRAGQRLLAQRQETPSGQRGWLTATGQVGTGFAHGATGMAYALLRLAQVSGDSMFTAAAREALDDERRQFAAGLATKNRTEVHSWCCGATGLGLGWLGALQLGEDQAIRQDITAALEAVRSTPGQPTDTLCCGKAGRVEFLLLAAQVLADASLMATAWQQATLLLGRSPAPDAFSLMTDQVDATFQPGLFQGLAGIGYQCLRLADPQGVPVVLLGA